jgi:glycosyltransferase involved in cell wall biosynthesis
MKTIPSNIWVVIPAFNEAKYIESVLKKVAQFTTHIIIFDDGSSDNTTYIANKHTKYVLVHKVNLGKGAALKTGCEFAFEHMKAEGVIVMDSDDQHDPTELPLFVTALEKASIVFGVRGFQKMPWLRVRGNKLLSSIVKLFFGTYIPDILSGYKAFSKDAYKAISWESSAYGVELEIAVRVARYKLPFELIPIKTIYHDMDRGMTLLDALSIMSRIISWRIIL